MPALCLGKDTRVYSGTMRILNLDNFLMVIVAGRALHYCMAKVLRPKIC